MEHGISSHIFLPQRLTPALLDRLRDAGASVIEVFAARHHFDYTDRNAVRELSNWFRSNDVAATLHMPIFSAEDEANWSRHTPATLNLIDTNKSARIAAMDEVKRALEAAEVAPFRSCVLHLGMKSDEWDTRAIDDSLTAIEHLKAFASPLGVQLLLENLANDVATPEHLVEIVRVGHFQTVGFCLDVGHANLAMPVAETSHSAAKSGVAQAFEAFGDRVVELHLHDNHGTVPGNSKDEHLWPGDGTVPWTEVAECVAAMKTAPVGMLEIAYELGEPDLAKARGAWELAAR
jgi:sugar phosphate isomerase/epimerase